jgi:hypothetical protein
METSRASVTDKINKLSDAHRTVKTAFFCDVTSGQKIEAEIVTKTVAVSYLSPKLHVAISNVHQHDNVRSDKIYFQSRFESGASGVVRFLMSGARNNNGRS